MALLARVPRGVNYWHDLWARHQKPSGVTDDKCWEVPPPPTLRMRRLLIATDRIFTSMSRMSMIGQPSVFRAKLALWRACIELIMW